MAKSGSFLVVWLIAICSSALVASPIVWVVPNSLLRVYPTDSPGSGTKVTIYCARGEYCPFQVAVQAPNGGLTNINFSVSNLSGPGGASIPSTDLIAYREQYITVSAHSPTYEGPPNLPITNQDTFPDPLVPFIDPTTGQYLRDGVQDYEYVQLLRNCGQTSFALSVANSVGKDWNWGDWTTDPNALESLATNWATRSPPATAPDDLLQRTRRKETNTSA